MIEQNLWSRPNCGVSHLQNLDGRYKKQVTLCDRGAFVEVSVIDRVTFDAVRNEVCYSIAAARDQGHEWAVAMDLYLK